ncbi:SDR family oxidoreductase [Aggregicoccus sp. 17bor-14]|uniref:SDR family oxidoreductase n=1 Tax=Myxococcaceae TaxID=31 RepID=UPI00129C8B03|nr:MULTISPECIES: SDR family oxidoreductase [Myxococcaceae]MBF5045784.1 SDR family oxidoreductase [Simulacricoccus sp. 17bor-14]MRI91519.1 SDR family oxidoreductase [Aggregicoccus sp. 17bor-14]
MILVTGATGTIGGEVARQLIAAGVRPRLLVRDPKKAREFEGKAERVQGDLAKPESLDAAFKGVEKLFLVSAGVDGRTLEKNAAAAAKRAGVKHIVKLSVIGADQPELVFSKWHAEMERAVRDSGAAWTFLRPGNFMSNALFWVQSIKDQGAIYEPTGQGRYASIDPADIGAVAVKALTQKGHEGQAYTMTGPESLSVGQVAEKLSRALGKPVKHVDVPPEAAREAMLKAGMPAPYVEALLDLSAFLKAGKADVVLPTVEQLLGRKAGTFDDWAKRNAAAFR